jgi:hypothetical protein
MKISIGINGFKKYNDLKKREKFCIDSLCKIQNKNTNIKLYNICYKNESVSYSQFTTLNLLEKKSNKIVHKHFTREGLEKEYNLRKTEIDNNLNELPIVNEIFDVLANTDCDYFLFLNNDIILSNRILKILEEKIDVYSISRMHIHDIDSLEDIPKLQSYSIHGFDAFLVKKDFWLEVRNVFEDMILGRFYWDTYFASMFNFLGNCKNINKLPPVCFHIEHQSKSSENTIENYYNEDIFKRNLLVSHTWMNYVQKVLMTRSTVNDCLWYTPHSNEEQLEKVYFTPFNAPVLYNNNFQKNTVTKSQNYDLFIPLIEKDELKLPYVLEHAIKNLNAKQIYICSPHNIKNKITNSNIHYINDHDILDVPDKSFITFRPNWTYQQFLKMFFKDSESEYYFALDCDTIILNSLELFDNNHPVWFYGWEQKHFPYFYHNRKFFNLNKTLPHTGIGDMGLFNKNITKSFLEYTNSATPKDLLTKIGSHLNVVFHFSEYETYANFSNQYYPNLYKFKQLDQYQKGRDLNIGENWTEADIIQTIKEAKETNKSILSIHSWKL